MIFLIILVGMIVLILTDCNGPKECKPNPEECKICPFPCDVRDKFLNE